MAYTAAGMPYNDVMSQYGVYGANTPQGGAGDAPQPYQSGAPEALLGGLGSGIGSLLTTGNPYLAAGMAAFNVYQGLKNSDAQEKAYELAKKQFEEQQANNRFERNLQTKNQDTQNSFTGAQAASQLQDSILGKYGTYLKSVGG